VQRSGGVSAIKRAPTIGRKTTVDFDRS